MRFPAEKRQKVSPRERSSSRSPEASDRPDKGQLAFSPICRVIVYRYGTSRRGIEEKKNGDIETDTHARTHRKGRRIKEAKVKGRRLVSLFGKGGKDTMTLWDHFKTLRIHV